ncbi:hypothetical protein CPT_Sonora_051 [Stenotrophomonas phage Sonora]|nr:hypothetical protein CPT_Sonora_051 [Stenotrophomonas phage Sonora]
MPGPVITPSKGESLLVARRRLGLNQVDAAAAFGVHPDIYREWEADKRTAGQPWKRLGALKIHEVCMLLRRRKGMTQRELAKQMGCTRLWVIQMENGEAPAERLREHWGV